MGWQLALHLFIYHSISNLNICLRTEVSILHACNCGMMIQVVLMNHTYAFSPTISYWVLSIVTEITEILLNITTAGAGFIHFSCPELTSAHIPPQH